MSRKKLVHYTDFLKDKTYSSILNVLKIAPTFNIYFKNGLKPGQLMHLIVWGYKTDFSRKLLDDFRKYIQENRYLNNKIKLDQEIAGKTPHQGFRHYLNNLEKTGWIIRGNKGRILLSKKYENELFKLENKEILNFYSQNQIMKISIKSNKRLHESLIETHILYGISNDMFNKMSNDYKETIHSNLDKIDESFRNIQEIKQKYQFEISEELDNITEKLKKSIDNEKIKQIPKKKNDLIWIKILGRLMDLQYSGKDICTLKKKDFFYQFGSEVIKKEKAVDAYIGAGKEWSLEYLGEDYDLTLDDVFNIINWAWDNRDIFGMYLPIEIAYSRFSFPRSIKDKFQPNF
jgi:hypothetical protein